MATTQDRAAARASGEAPAQAPEPRAYHGLDELLTEAGAGGAGQRWWPGLAGVKLAARLAARPGAVTRRTAGMAFELGKIAAGRSEVAPDRKDRRFQDPAWAGNPALRRLLQTYLATGRTVDELVRDADLDWKAERRVRFVAENILDAAAPSNVPVLNPAVLKTAIDTGGLNFVRGARKFARDMSRPPRIPSMVDTSAFAVGENLALTPGAVVLRRPAFELIQYRPTTEQVREQPLVIVPPMINKFYIVDIAPERSMVEHLVAAGQQVFVLSWRNPGAEAADWDLDTYAGSVIEALDVAEVITGADRCQVLGLCAGGITATCALGHLAARGTLDRISGLTLGVTVLDQARAGTAGALMDRSTAAAAVADSARRGYLDGRALAGVFAWLRPNDLIWNYWVNNYLMGKDPPAFDILYWNADTTNMPAGLHRDFVGISLENALVQPGAVRVLGTPIDLGAIDVDAYVVAGIADHITPWENAYRTTQLLGSHPRFVLSTSGHIAALVNPPGNPKASYQLNTDNPPSPEDFLAGASTHRGTWWEDWASWLGERSGPSGPRRASSAATAIRRSSPRPGRTSRPRSAVPARQRSAPARRAPRAGGRRAPAAHHGLHDQRGHLRARAGPLRRAAAVHPLRQPRVGAVGEPAAPDLHAGARGGRRRGARGASAWTAPTSTACRWAGWSPRSWPSPSPNACAGSSWGARRRAARSPPARRAPSCARWPRRWPTAAAGPAAPGWPGPCSPTASAASSPTRSAACCAPSPPTGPGPAAPPGTCGPRSTTTRCRGWARSRPRRSSCTAPTTSWPRRPTRGCSPTASRARSSPWWRARGTRTPSRRPSARQPCCWTGSTGAGRSPRAARAPAWPRAPSR
jgi:polyhydroxyalkanoate synthase